ncbi:MAG: ATP-binding cassette domain-containing protein [Acidobacteriota bacterium]|nr:ATP-binding cassette domain-containing protein [Acidobacteriota bacterium]
MLVARDLLQTRIDDLRREYPFVDSFFDSQQLDVSAAGALTLGAFLEQAAARHDDDDAVLSAEEVAARLSEHIEQMLLFLEDDRERVRTLTLLPGTDKCGEPEGFERIDFKAGETVCIVGPTGSGKSRLLADIEWVAQRDTPTRRSVLLNGEAPSRQWRFSPTHKLVAQLSQNMNFVMDLSVEEFLRMHAESRVVANPEPLIARIHEEANRLAGESFSATTPITSLSGGQSRALMIADTAILSRSPIVLIDEIENAGIDRKKALELLVSEEKIVLMATHDPVLALMGSRRLVIRNGGIAEVIETSEKEREILSELEAIDRRLMTLRHKLRTGERLV